MRRILAVLVCLVALLPIHAASGGATGTPTFRVSETPSYGVELNLAVLNNGHVFVGGWVGTGPGLVKSTDDGLTWQTTGGMRVGGAIGTDDVSADRTLTADKETGRVFVDDTYLGCTVLSWTDDEGATWLRNPIACGVGATDHEKIAVGHRVGTAATLPAPLYPNAVYVCANGLSHDNCGTSLDGGLTVVSGEPHGVGCAFQGQVYAAPDGTVYEPTVACGAKLHVSANNGLTWTDVAVPVSAADNTGTLADVAATPDGTVYFLYADTSYHAKYVYSHNKGASWSQPVDVTPAGVTSVGFPVIVAGDDGRIGVAMYGTTAASAAGVNPGSVGTGVAWNGYVGIVTGADSATPTIQTTQVTADPLAYGCISKDGGCGGDPLADYFDVDVGPDGRVYAVFGDACPAATCTGFGSMGAARAVVAVQTGGTNLKA